MPAATAPTVSTAAVAATAVRTATAARRTGATTAATLAHATTTFARTHVLRRGLDTVTHRAPVATAFRTRTLRARGT